MAFGNLGTAEVDDNNIDSLKFFIKYYFFNSDYDNYVNKMYPQLINKSIVQDLKPNEISVAKLNQNKSTKNSYLIWELKTVSGIIQNIENIGPQKIFPSNFKIPILK